MIWFHYNEVKSLSMDSIYVHKSMHACVCVYVQACKRTWICTFGWVFVGSFSSYVGRSSACFSLFSSSHFVRKQSTLLRLLALFLLDLIRQALIGILLNALQSHTLLVDTFQVQVCIFILVSIKEGETSSSGCRQQSGRYWLKKKKDICSSIWVCICYGFDLCSVSGLNLCLASQPRRYCLLGCLDFKDLEVSWGF